MRYISRYSVIVFAFCFWLAGTAAAEQGHWMIASNTLSASGQPTPQSVSIWRASPRAGERVDWFGGHVFSREANGLVASGKGTAIWYLNGLPQYKEEGEFIKGRLQGTVLQTYTDGWQVTSKWQNGLPLLPENSSPGSSQILLYFYQEGQVVTASLPQTQPPQSPTQVLQALFQQLKLPPFTGQIKTTDNSLQVDWRMTSLPIAAGQENRDFTTAYQRDQELLSAISLTLSKQFNKSVKQINWKPSSHSH